MMHLDCGQVPPGAFALDAHAGSWRLRLSSGPHRLVVNCGAGGEDHAGWDAALRATAAHSTLTLADTSSAPDPAAGPGARSAGAAADRAARQQPLSRRSETAQGWMVEASHDAYVAPNSVLRHERRITLSPQGLMVTGRRPAGAGGHGAGSMLPFAVRFHIHPDVRVSRLEGGGILLKLPGGEGWRFRAGGGELAIEESIYLGGGAVRRTEQLVITRHGARKPRRSRMGVRADCRV